MVAMSRKVKEMMMDNGKLPAFAWPGGYPLFYFTNQSIVLCPPCANAEDYSDEITDYDVNWEDPHMSCDNCGQYIDPAYIDGEELEAARRAGVQEE